MNYSQRAIEIVAMLLMNDSYMSVAAIAEKLNISKRTVFREMEDVETIAEKFGMTLDKKARVGIKIEADASSKNAFEREVKINKQTHFDQDMRQRLLTIELLKSKEARKLYYFSNMLGVSEATISYDMDKIEGWFTSRNITLIRKPGYGVYLEADEAKLRKGIIDFLYENYEHQDLISLIETESQQETMLTSLIDKSILFKNAEILKSFEEFLAKRLTDQAYMGLLIHLSIAVQRTLKGERIVMNQMLLDELILDAHFEMAKAIGNKIKEVFGITFPDDELGYISMHLKGSKLKSSVVLDEQEFMLSNFQLSRLAANMIKRFKTESGYDFRQDERLLVGLVSHLRPAITRMSLSLDIRNPLLDKIKEMYPEIFKMSKSTCDCMTEGFDFSVPDEEVGYIAMHFGAAIERFEKKQLTERQINVGVVCSSGVGTSSLLYSRLNKLFPKLTLMGQFSKEEVLLAPEKFRDIELLISTISLSESVLPVVKVNPLLLSEDVEKINQVIHLVKEVKMKPQVDHDEIKQNKSSDLDQIERIHEMTEAVLTLISQFDLIEGSDCENIGQLIKLVVAHYSTDFLQKRKLQKQFLQREKLGSTYIHGEGIVLLHTKSNIFEEVTFSVWRMKTPFIIEKGETVFVGIVMGIPEHPTKVQTEVLSQISKALIEDELFVQSIKYEDETVIEKSLNLILKQWISQTLVTGGFSNV